MIIFFKRNIDDLNQLDNIFSRVRIQFIYTNSRAKTMTGDKEFSRIHKKSKISRRPTETVKRKNLIKRIANPKTFKRFFVENISQLYK